MGHVIGIVAKRLGLGLLTLLVVSALIFIAVELLPGDIAQAVLGQGATESNLAALRAELGLNDSPFLRYFRWLQGAVVGDFGTSLATRDSVTEAILPRLKNTLFLATYAAAIAVPVAITLHHIDRNLITRILPRLHSNFIFLDQNGLVSIDRESECRYDFF